MKKTKILVLSAVLFVAAFAITAIVHFSNSVSANHNSEVISECDVVRQQENTPPTNAWVLYTRTPASVGVFVNGPGNPPLSDGSLQLTTPSGGDKVFLFNYEHIGTPLSSINSLGYSTYQISAASPNQLPAINIQVDINGGTLNPGEFTTLVFEPVYNTYQGAIAPGVWQNWNAYDGGNAIWWSTRPIPGVCAFNCFVTWNTILANNPNATIVGGFGVNQGSGNPGLNAATDALNIGYGSNSYTYNFDVDADCDDVADGDDNCPNTANTNQLDTDNDGAGNVCDPDDDNDGQSDADEIACGSDPLNTSSKSLDTDGDNIPNCVDPDDDNDGDLDGADNCPLVSNPNQADSDNDGIGDACDQFPTPPTSKEQCKNGGFNNYRRPDGSKFKNQGDCIQFVNTGK
jgi:hypothetical protein